MCIVFRLNEIRRGIQNTSEIHTLKVYSFYIFLLVFEAKMSIQKEETKTIKVQSENEYFEHEFHIVQQFSSIFPRNWVNNFEMIQYSCKEFER